MDEQFFYAIGGKQFGPVTLEDLKKCAQSGDLKRTDKVWRRGMKEWQPASVLAKVFDGLPPDLEKESHSPVIRWKEPEASPASGSNQVLLQEKMAQPVGTELLIHCADETFTRHVEVPRSRSNRLKTILVPASFLAAVIILVVSAYFGESYISRKHVAGSLMPIILGMCFIIAVLVLRQGLKGWSVTRSCADSDILNRRITKLQWFCLTTLVVSSCIVLVYIRYHKEWAENRASRKAAADTKRAWENFAAYRRHLMLSTGVKFDDHDQEVLGWALTGVGKPVPTTSHIFAPTVTNWDSEYVIVKQCPNIASALKYVRGKGWDEQKVTDLLGLLRQLIEPVPPLDAWALAGTKVFPQTVEEIADYSVNSAGAVQEGRARGMSDAEIMRLWEVARNSTSSYHEHSVIVQGNGAEYMDADHIELAHHKQRNPLGALTVESNGLTEAEALRFFRGEICSRTGKPVTVGDILYERRGQHEQQHQQSGTVQ